MATKTLTAILFVIALVILIPIGIGIIGGVFGLVAGIFGAIFGIIGGIFGAVFGAIGWLFQSIFSGGLLTFIIVVVAIVILTKRPR